MTTISKCVCGCYFRHQSVSLCGKVAEYGYCDQRCPKLGSGEPQNLQCSDFQILDTIIICKHTQKKEFCPKCTTQKYDESIAYVFSDGLLHVPHPELPYQKYFEHGCPNMQKLMKCEPLTFKSPKCRKFVAKASKAKFRCCDKCSMVEDSERVDHDLCYYCEDNLPSSEPHFKGSGLCTTCGTLRTCMACHNVYVDPIESVDTNRCLNCHNANPNSLLCIGCEKTFVFGSFHVPFREIVRDNMCLSCFPSGRYHDILISKEMENFVELMFWLQKELRYIPSNIHTLIEIICTSAKFYGYTLKKLHKTIANRGRYGKMLIQWNQNQEASSAIVFTSWCSKDIRLKIMQYVHM